MHLGVPFIAPRQLGAVESKSGRPILPSVVGCTGQSGAHPTLSGARVPSLNSAANRCRSGSCWRTGHVRCTPDSPVHTGQSGAPFRPLARPRVPRRSRGRPLAHRTVRCTPDSPVIFSRTPSANSRERPLHVESAWRTGHCPVHHRTVRCARPSRVWAVHSQAFSPLSFLLLSVSNT
jgi:hypothetical protein